MLRRPARSTCLRPAVRLWLRLDRPLRLREEQARLVQAPAVQLHGRLGHVQGHLDRPIPFCERRTSTCPGARPARRALSTSSPADRPLEPSPLVFCNPPSDWSAARATSCRPRRALYGDDAWERPAASNAPSLRSHQLRTTAPGRDRPLGAHPGVPRRRCERPGRVGVHHRHRHPRGRDRRARR